MLYNWGKKSQHCVTPLSWYYGSILMVHKCHEDSDVWFGSLKKNSMSQAQKQKCHHITQNWNVVLQLYLKHSCQLNNLFFSIRSYIFFHYAGNSDEMWNILQQITKRKLKVSRTLVERVAADGVVIRNQIFRAEVLVGLLSDILFMGQDLNLTRFHFC